MPTDQRRFIAATFGLTVIRAVALQGPLRQTFAVFAAMNLRWSVGISYTSPNTRVRHGMTCG